MKPDAHKINCLQKRLSHFKSDFRLRRRDKVERVAMSLRR